MKAARVIVAVLCGLAGLHFLWAAVTNRPIQGDILSSGTGWVSAVTNGVGQWSGTTGGLAPGAGSTVYLPPNNSHNSLPTTDSVAITRTPSTRLTTLQNLFVVVSAGPGATRTNTVTVMTNGAASPLSVNIVGNTTIGSNVLDTVSVPAGTEIGIRIMTAGGAAASRTAWGFEGR